MTWRHSMDGIAYAISRKRLSFPSAASGLEVAHAHCAALFGDPPHHFYSFCLCARTKDDSYGLTS